MQLTLTAATGSQELKRVEVKDLAIWLDKQFLGKKDQHAAKTKSQDKL